MISTSNESKKMCSEKVQLILCLATTAVSIGLYIPLVFGLCNWALRCLPILLFLICIGVILLSALIISIVWLARYRREMINTKINSTFQLDHPLFPTDEELKYQQVHGSNNNNNNYDYPGVSLSSPSSCCCSATSCISLFQIITLAMTFIILLFSTSAYTYFSDGRRGPTHVQGISSKVEIQLSEKNVLHINAETRSDAMFAQGLLTAELRLWQMELQRRLGQGRLSEFVGHLALPTDKLMRTLGFVCSTIILSIVFLNFFSPFTF